MNDEGGHCSPEEFPELFDRIHLELGMEPLPPWL